MIRIRTIDHIVLRSENVPAMQRFYVEVLGCTLERELPATVGLVQLRAGEALIDLVAVDSELGRQGGGPPGREGNNLDHFCLQVADADPEQLRSWLESHDIDCGDFQTRYGAGGFGPSVYIEDPDGNTIELRPTPAETKGE